MTQRQGRGEQPRTAANLMQTPVSLLQQGFYPFYSNLLSNGYIALRQQPRILFWNFLLCQTEKAWDWDHSWKGCTHVLIIPGNGEHTQKRIRPQHDYVSNSREQKGTGGSHETPTVTRFFPGKEEFPSCKTSVPPQGLEFGFEKNHFQKPRTCNCLDRKWLKHKQIFWPSHAWGREAY